MPIKGDVKKQFLAMREMVKDSLTLSTRFLVEQGLAAARRDGVISGENMERAFSRKKNKPYKRYKEITAANVKSKAGRRLFHYSKFISRAGNLLKALTPAGWNGNKLATMGKSHAEIEKTASGVKATIVFDDPIGIVLKGGKNAKVKDKVQITDKEGNVIGDRTVRRRIIQDGFRSVINLWNTKLKQELDKKAKEFFK